ELLKELEESFTGDARSKHSPKEKSFLDGVKKFFDDLTR
ncbi:MAG: molecular chaperone DnaJ, partial [Plesiomonas shigelloides]